MFANLLKIKKTKKSHVPKHSQPLLNTLLMHLWQQLQPQVFLNMMPQPWHTYLWAVSHIPLCSTSQPPSGWRGSVGAQPFSDLSRDVQSDPSWALAGPLKDIHRAVLKPLLFFFFFKIFFGHF